MTRPQQSLNIYTVYFCQWDMFTVKIKCCFYKVWLVPRTRVWLYFHLQKTTVFWKNLQSLNPWTWTTKRRNDLVMCGQTLSWLCHIYTTENHKHRASESSFTQNHIGLLVQLSDICKYKCSFIFIINFFITSTFLFFPGCWFVVRVLIRRRLLWKLFCLL